MIGWSVAVRRLLLDKALGFPSTLLMMGLSNGVTYVLLQFTVICSRFCITLGTDPDWKGAGVFGAMRAIQGALSVHAMCSSESYHNAILMAFSVTLCAAGMANRSEKSSFLVALAAVLAMA